MRIMMHLWMILLYYGMPTKHLWEVFFHYTWARAKRQRQKQISDLIEEIDIIDTKNKQKPSSVLSPKLTKFHHDPYSLLLDNFEKAARRLKMTYYACGNKASKLLAHKLRGQRQKTRTPFLSHTSTTIHCITLIKTPTLVSQMQNWSRGSYKR